MYRKEMNEQSPLRILEASIHGGLGKGNLGVVMAGPGVGKTACLVQIGLDDLMRRRKVLHIALGGMNVDEVVLWYDELFNDLANTSGLKDRIEAKMSMKKLRIIRTTSKTTLDEERLESVTKMLAENLAFTPEAIIVDGYDWNQSVDHTRVVLMALKAIGKRIGAEVWMSACVPSEAVRAQPTEVIAPCDTCDDLIDVALLLDPKRGHVAIRLLKDHDREDLAADTMLELQCNTMRLIVAA